MLASLLYSLIFTWVLEQANEKLYDTKTATNFVGLVDFAGLDIRQIMKPNHFFQFASNYSHEKIQQFVWSGISESLLDSASIDNSMWNSQLVLQAYEATRSSGGLFSTIDAYTLEHQKERDGVIEEMMLEELKRNNNQSSSSSPSSSSILTVSPPGWSSFVIRHDIGKITYSADSFIRTNRSNSWSRGLVQLFGMGSGLSEKNETAVGRMLAQVETDVTKHPKNKTTIISIQHGGFFKRALDEKAYTDKKVRSPGGASSPLKAAMDGVSPTSATSPSMPSKSTSSISSAVCKNTVLSSYKIALDQLIFKLVSSRVWPVHCLLATRGNNNDDKAVDEPRLIQQIKALRLVPLIKVTAMMKYTVEYTVQEFVKRYSIALGFDKALMGSPQELKMHLSMIFSREDITADKVLLTDTDVYMSEMYWRSLESRLDMKLPMRSRRIHINKSTQVEEEELASEKKQNLEIAAKAGKSSSSWFSGLQLFNRNKNSVAPTTVADNHTSKMKKGEDKKLSAKGEKNAEEEVAKKNSSWRLRRRGVAKAELNEKPQSAQRKYWLMYTWLNTFWIPDIVLERVGGMHLPETRLSWREKLTLCFIILWLSGLMLFFVQGLSKANCRKRVSVCYISNC